MKITLITLLLLMLLGACFGATGTSELHARLKAAYQNLDSFQAAVRQSNYYPSLKKTISYSGNIYFIPGRMLMSFTKPSVQRLKINGSQVELYDAMSKTLFRSEVLPEFGRMNPVEILQIYWSKSAVQVSSEDKVNATVKLVPKSDDLISSLTATLNKKSGIVSKLSYTDKSGNTVTYSFSGIRLNAGIPASVWNQGYPKDVQIIEQ